MLTPESRQEELFTELDGRFIRWNEPLQEGIDYVDVVKRQEALLITLGHLGQIASRTGFSNRYRRSEGDREVVNEEYSRRRRGPASPAIVRDKIVPGAEKNRGEHYDGATSSFMSVVGESDPDEAEELWKSLRAEMAGTGEATRARNEYIKKLRRAQRVYRAAGKPGQSEAA